MLKKIGNKKIRKSGNGNVFQNRIKIITFFYPADLEILSCIGHFFNQEGGTRLKLVLQPWLVMP